MFNKDPFDDAIIARYAQLGLRLLGVFFLLEGVCNTAGSLVYAAMQSHSLKQAGYQPLPDAYALGWFASSFAMIAAGVYFAVGGSWVLEKVFFPASRSTGVEHDDIPDVDAER